MSLAEPAASASHRRFTTSLHLLAVLHCATLVSAAEELTALKPRDMKVNGCPVPLECAWSLSDDLTNGPTTEWQWAPTYIIFNTTKRRPIPTSGDARVHLNNLYERNKLAKVGLPLLALSSDIHVIPTGGEPYMRRTLRDADMVLEGFGMAGKWQPQPGEAWLDFGGSHGRITRIMAAAYPNTSWWCTDPIEGSIEYGKKHVPSVNFVKTNQDPPIRVFEDEKFHSVYAVSIWSHYNEAPALAWFREMHRIMAPGGLLWFTTHGFQSINFGMLDAAPQKPHRTGLFDQLYKKGHAFFPMFGSSGDFGLPDGSSAGMKWGWGGFTTEWLAAKVLNGDDRPWKLEYFGPGRSERNQDVYVLRKRKGSACEAASQAQQTPAQAGHPPPRRKGFGKLFNWRRN